MTHKKKRTRNLTKNFYQEHNEQLRTEIYTLQLIQILVTNYSYDNSRKFVLTKFADSKY